jgi:predicted amidohydrolase
MRAAVVQSVPVSGGVDENLRRTQSVVEQAVAAGARLIVFPELSLTGYDLALGDDPRMWFTPGDDRLAGVRRAAAGATVVVGALVRSGSRRHIASLVLNHAAPDLVAPKTYLHGAESDLVEPGEGPAVVAVDGWNVGLAICYDTAFPEHAAAAHAAGAQVYAASALFTAGEESKLSGRMVSRAVDHGLWTLMANLGGHQLGERSAGGSGAWAPDGSVAARAAGCDEEIVTAQLHQQN